MDFSKIIKALETGVDFAEQMAPLISVLPGGALVNTAISAINAVSDTVKNVQERVSEGQIVATSQDQAQIRGMAERLSAVNDRLAQRIDES